MLLMHNFKLRLWSVIWPLFSPNVYLLLREDVLLLCFLFNFDLLQFLFWDNCASSNGSVIDFCFHLDTWLGYLFILNTVQTSWSQGGTKYMAWVIIIICAKHIGQCLDLRN